jgi:hypothetical protein
LQYVVLQPAHAHYGKGALPQHTGMDTAGMGTTSRKLYSARRGDLRYVASWDLHGSVLKWTAVITGANAFLKLLLGQLDFVEPGADLQALVRREVEERVDLQTWLE